ncbi:hypothetical protein L917_18475 [Phytophthora nicotianae]|uniref:Transposase Tc1-like domain-containing protein n=1 Tax=Phytophthora nicotianae TaxID=4792 RepID=W2K7I2_PHYNI|nr:hypothetical protein L917_18475 [Phytophthora nicotianae]
MRHLAAGVFRRATTRVKPKLTDVHKARRLAFALAHVERVFGGRDYRMHRMYDYVHVDEKWFNLYKVSTRYYLTKDELAPYQTCPNRRYIGKVMFLAAVARPRYDAKRKTYVDGKIGIWPVVEYVRAQRSWQIEQKTLLR